MAEEGLVIGCHSVDAWKEQLQQANTSNKVLLVDFTASWCGPCRIMAPILADLAKKFPNLTYLKVDVDELKTVAEDCKIEAMPTFIFFKEGQIIDKIVGARKDDLAEKVALYSASVSASV